MITIKRGTTRQRRFLRRRMRRFRGWLAITYPTRMPHDGHHGLGHSISSPPVDQR